MLVQVLKRWFTVEEYYRMAEAGILSEDDRVELIEGEIVQMAPIGSNHAGHVARLTMLFTHCFGQRSIVRVQNPIRLDQYSEPQPDLTLLHPCPDFYAKAHPGPEDILLVVEVADTSMEFDRTVKAPLYARAGVSEVWLVDLPEECIEVYRKPSSNGYEEVNRFQRGQTLSILAFPGVEINADEILG